MMKLIITGLPRSATAWLSLYFGNPNFTIVHEISSYAHDARKYISGAAGPDWLSQSLSYIPRDTVGGRSMYQVFLQHVHMLHTPVVLVRRNADDAKDDFSDFTAGLGGDTAAMGKIFDAARRAYDDVVEFSTRQNLPNVFIIDFEDLFDYGHMEALSDWLSLLRGLTTNVTNPTWHEHMLSCFVAINFPHVCERIATAHSMEAT